jgi:hypothetical protein
MNKQLKLVLQKEVGDEIVGYKIRRRLLSNCRCSGGCERYVVGSNKELKIDIHDRHTPLVTLDGKVLEIEKNKCIE